MNCWNELRNVKYALMYIKSYYLCMIKRVHSNHLKDSTSSTAEVAWSY